MCEPKTICIVQILLWLNYLWHFPCCKARKQLGGRCDNLTVIYDNTMLRVRQTGFRGLTGVDLLLFLPLRKENVRSKLSNCSVFFCLCQEWEPRTDALKQTAACSQLTASCGFSPISAKYEKNVDSVFASLNSFCQSCMLYILLATFKCILLYFKCRFLDALLLLFQAATGFHWCLNGISRSVSQKHHVCITFLSMLLYHCMLRQFTCGLIRRVCSRPVE